MPPAFIPLSQRVGYTTAQIRLLFGTSDGQGKIIPVHPCTVARWRKSGAIPFERINSRNFRYPRAKIDELLALRREEKQEKEELAQWG